MQNRLSQQWALLGDPQGSRGRGGALHIGHRFADDRCLWSEQPQGVLRRQACCPAGGALSDESDGVDGSACLVGQVGRGIPVGASFSILYNELNSFCTTQMRHPRPCAEDAFLVRKRLQETGRDSERQLLSAKVLYLHR